MSSCEAVKEIGRATEISDGSFKNNRGTASCTIEANNNNNSRIYAVHDTPGNITDQSPYRSELGGISMMLLVRQCDIRYYGITQCSIQLGLDRKRRWNKQVEHLFSTPNNVPLIYWWIYGKHITPPYTSYILLGGRPSIPTTWETITHGGHQR